MSKFLNLSHFCYLFLSVYDLYVSVSIFSVNIYRFWGSISQASIFVRFQKRSFTIISKIWNNSIKIIRQSDSEQFILIWFSDFTKCNLWCINVISNLNFHVELSARNYGLEINWNISFNTISQSWTLCKIQNYRVKITSTKKIQLKNVASGNTFAISGRASTSRTNAKSKRKFAHRTFRDRPSSNYPSYIQIYVATFMISLSRETELAAKAPAASHSITTI